MPASFQLLPRCCSISCLSLSSIDTFRASSFNLFVSHRSVNLALVFEIYYVHDMCATLSFNAITCMCYWIISFCFPYQFMHALRTRIVVEECFNLPHGRSCNGQGYTEATWRFWPTWTSTLTRWLGSSTSTIGYSPSREISTTWPLLPMLRWQKWSHTGGRGLEPPYLVDLEGGE